MHFAALSDSSASSGGSSSSETLGSGADSAGSIEDLERQGQLIAQSRPDLLRQVSDAQRKVLELLLVGCTEPRIAERLGRSKHTVHDHTKAIYSHLGVKSRVQLVLLFSRPPGESSARVG